MYLAHYNLKIKPFQMSTDPKFLWLGEKHKEALAILKYGILENKGVLALTGDVGTGKTTLINALVKNLGKDIIVATIYDPGLEPVEFFNIVATSFNMGVTFKNKGQFLIHFKEFLQNARKQNRKVLLIIDEAQRIGSKLLEEVRLLSNLEAEHIRLLNIFFIGQDEFVDILQEDINRALRQRIAISYDIKPLTLKETAAYVNHRLRIAGAKTPIFAQGVFQEIFDFSSGYPRLINIICDHALLSGFVKGAQSINLDIIRECKKELRVSEWLPRQKTIEKEDTIEERKQDQLSGQDEKRNAEHDSVRLARGLYQKAPPPKPDKMPVGLVILSVLLLFLIAGVAGYVYYNSGKIKLKIPDMLSLKKDKTSDAKQPMLVTDKEYLVPFIPESKEKEAPQTAESVATSSGSEIKEYEESTSKEPASEDDGERDIQRGARGDGMEYPSTLEPKKPVLTPTTKATAKSLEKTISKEVKPELSSKKEEIKVQPVVSKVGISSAVGLKKDEQTINADSAKKDTAKNGVSDKKKDLMITDATAGLTVEKDKKPETNLARASSGVRDTEPPALAKKAAAPEGNVKEESVRSNENLQVRLTSFLQSYCNAYATKQLDDFTTFFTPDAVEKGKPFTLQLPKYRSTFQVIDSMTYRIDLKRYSVQEASGFIRLEGTYYVRARLNRGGGEWRESSGGIYMELEDQGSSFRVRQLDY